MIRKKGAEMAEAAEEDNAGEEEAEARVKAAKSSQKYKPENNDQEPEAFLACVDVGLDRTSTGAKVFTAHKGAGNVVLISPIP